MKNSKVPKISEAEWAVMELLWERGPMRSGEIVEAIGQHPKTVKTYIGRLVKKGAVVAEKKGTVYHYRPMVRKFIYQDVESRSFLEKVFGGSLIPMLAHFVRNNRLTDEEIESLRKVLDERGKK